MGLADGAAWEKEHGYKKPEKQSNKADETLNVFDVMDTIKVLEERKGGPITFGDLFIEYGIGVSNDSTK